MSSPGTKMQLRMGLKQGLKLTPRLQQSLRLLQLSSLELKTELQEALDSNIMLEADNEEPGGNEQDTDSSDGEDAETPEDADVITDDLTEDLPVDVEWEEIYDSDFLPVSGASQGTADTENLWEQNEQGTSLQTHLAAQLTLLDLTPREKHIASCLVDALDENGYLTENPEELCASMGVHGQINEPLEEEFERMLGVIQEQDPAGVGARNLQECLLLQLKQQAKAAPPAVATDACTLVANHLSRFAAGDLEKLADDLGWSRERLEGAAHLVRSLDPHPGAQLEADRTEYIAPDVYVTLKNKRWVLSLNKEAVPKLRINPHYHALALGRNQDAQRLKADLQEARWLLKSLHDRQEMLLRVSSSIVQRQCAFLEHGEEAMKPMVLGDIATELQVHESTVSRAIAGKHIHSPQGLHPLKFFFSSRLEGVNKQLSSTAVRAAIRGLIEQEPLYQPLSDNHIVTRLHDMGIRVARRTVAKYREQLKIPPSHERKRKADTVTGR